MSSNSRPQISLMARNDGGRLTETRSRRAWLNLGNTPRDVSTSFARKHGYRPWVGEAGGVKAREGGVGTSVVMVHDCAKKSVPSSNELLSVGSSCFISHRKVCTALSTETLSARNKPTPATPETSESETLSNT